MEDRIDAIDILRGCALFGVLMVNLLTEFRVSIFEQFLPGEKLALHWTISLKFLCRLFLNRRPSLCSRYCLVWDSQCNLIGCH